MGRKGGTTMEKWASGIRIRQRQADQKLPKGRKGGVGSRWGFRCFGFDSIALSLLQDRPNAERIEQYCTCVIM